MSEYAFEGFILREVAGKYNLLNLNNMDVPYTQPLRLNETGATIWKEITKGKTTEEIAEFLAAKYDISKETAGEDLAAFVKELKKFGVPLLI